MGLAEDYGNLFNRLLNGVVDIINIAAELNEGSYEIPINPFSDLISSIGYSIIDCFLENNFFGNHLIFAHDLTKLFDESLAQEFHDNVLSKFLIDDFVVPKAHVDYFELAHQAYYLYSLLKFDNKDLNGSFDEIINPLTLDLKSFLKKPLSNDHFIKASKAMNAYNQFLISVREAPFAELLLTINDCDILSINDYQLGPVFFDESLSDELAEKIFSVINNYNGRNARAYTEVEPFKDFVPEFGMDIIDYTGKIKKSLKLVPDSSLYI